MRAHQLLLQDSGNTEFYTPARIVEAAREVMGGIDLDPASCVKANETIRAARYFTKEDDGLLHPWHGRVWMNHPFSKGEEPCHLTSCSKKRCAERGYHITERVPSNQDWIDKLLLEVLLGNTSDACCITWANMSEGWMVPLLDFPQCFPHERIHYNNAEGNEQKGATKGSVITYLGPNVERFAEVFSEIGTVKVPYR